MKAIYLTSLFLLTLLSGCFQARESGPVASVLDAQLLSNKLGLDFDEIEFSWSHNSKDSSTTSYQILVASERDILKHDIGDLWDSGRTFSVETSDCYRGKPLTERKTIWWKVRLWNAKGVAGKFSEPQSIRISQMGTGNRLALVGGSLISSMEDHGYFETELVRRWPHRRIVVRNLGWPADDIFGLARSQFGSAQNTRSWQPPTAEEGFGSKVLVEHIEQANPSTIMIGYGSQAAFFEDEADFALFESGYRRLLDGVDSMGSRMILLAPPKQEQVFITRTELEERNARLARVRDFIRTQAGERNLVFIDLFEMLITEPNHQKFSEDGIQLNALGYQRLSEIMLTELGIETRTKSTLHLAEDGSVARTTNCSVSDWTQTVRGSMFEVTGGSLSHGVHVSSGGPLAIFLDGGVRQRGSDSMMISLPQDSLQLKKLRMAIKEKNRLHRWRLRPLNEAYIFLFRRHEMGHLAYEMEDYAALVTEKEDEIARLAQPGTYHVNIELIKPWQPPKNYPEDEVPAHVPEPDIAQELEAFHIADGFEVNLFAADPMIANPINLNWDTRGRAWVATSSTYPHIEPGREPSDRIVILEDSDGDGQADRSIVFAEGLLVPHSVMPVPGGAYVTSTTEFLFLADTNGDDVADERRVVFDGFGNADVHHMIHGLRWAPWGGLYFTQSIYINSFVETAYGPRRLNGTGIWHFHPETEQLEVFSRGLINPWGHAFDQWGQSFTTDGAGSSGINYIFPESAHATAVGAARILQGLNAGTPKNTAAEVVYSQHLPREWQGSILTNDFRANRTVRYEIVPEGSGYRAKEVETVLHSDHRSYRPVDTKIGPDGAVYIVDWYNPIIDHGEVDFHHPIRDKSHGRIWRLTNQKRPLLPRSNLHQASISALLNALKSTEYYTRVQANRELVARQCDPKILQSWFRSLPRSHPDFELHRLEALWLGAALQYYDGSLMDETLRSKNPHARAAALRMVKHWNMQPEKMDQLGVMIHDPHPQVRLEAIHTLRSFPTLQTASIVMESLDHPMDANLEYATWFSARDMQQVWLPAMREGVEVFENDVNRQMYALLACEEAHVISLVQDRISNPEVKDTLVNQAWTMMAQLGDASALAMVLEETVKTNNYRLLSSLANAPIANEAIPHNLDLLEEFLDHDNPDVQITAAKLVGRWKAERYLELLKRMFSDPSTSVELRMSTGKALIELGQIKFVRDNATKGTDLSVRAAASAVWAGKEPRQAVESVIDLLVDIEDDADAELLFLTYRNMEDGPDILAKKLSQVKLSESVASVGLRIAQTSGLNLTDLETAIRKAGSLAPVGTQMNHSQRTRLIEEALKSGNRYRGSQVYRRPQLLCATCHRIDGIGGLIGPDLTTLGSYMTPGSILESLLQPNSDVKQGYETVIATLADGQVVSGTLHRKADDATMIRMANNEIRSIPNAELEKLDVSEASLMPAGLTASLHRDELKDLLYFLSNLGVEN